MNNKGFTLIELVIAITVISLIVAATTGVILTLNTTKGSVMQGADFAQQSRAVLERLDTEIQGMPSVKTGRYFFAGESDSVSFTSMTTYQFPGIPTKAHYRFKKDKGQLKLSIFGDNDEAIVKPISLNFSSLSFRFFDGQNWTDRWDEVTPYAPNAVEVLISKTDRDGKVESYRKVIGVLK